MNKIYEAVCSAPHDELRLCVSYDLEECWEAIEKLQEYLTPSEQKTRHFYVYAYEVESRKGFTTAMAALEDLINSSLCNDPVPVESYTYTVTYPNLAETKD